MYFLLLYKKRLDIMTSTIQYRTHNANIWLNDGRTYHFWTLQCYKRSTHSIPTILKLWYVPRPVICRMKPSWWTWIDDMDWWTSFWHWVAEMSQSYDHRGNYRFPIPHCVGEWWELVSGIKEFNAVWYIKGILRQNPLVYWRVSVLKLLHFL